jgi:hypothetical protein
LISKALNTAAIANIIANAIAFNFALLNNAVFYVTGIMSAKHL